MLDWFEASARTLRRWVSRSEWAIRWLRLSVSVGTAASPGLVVIQVDGLSRMHFQRAMARGQLPFLKRLMEREHYLLHPQYSGLPASTPAVQAELFYGVKGAVPAFSFLDHSCGCIFRMYEPKSAAEVEQRLAAQGPGLLEGGSAYTDIFSGGAAESHFCASTLGWDKLLRALNPVTLPLLVLARLDLVFRVAILMVAETVLALWDFVRGTLAGKGLLDELFFVPTRVAICILLRELVALGAQVDIARGLPIIHVNLIGYDEQSHRRGPSSRFAQWTLRGIDGAIRRLWDAAQRSARRNYDVWIYSDHGQEDATPYAQLHGRTVQEAVQSVTERIGADGLVKGGDEQGVQSKRVILLGGLWSVLFPRKPERVDFGSKLTVTAMGSLGHVYPSRTLTDDERRRVAEQLVREAHIPLVLCRQALGRATAWTEQGIFNLPEDAARLFGEDHPYLPDVAKDLVDLCHHPDAGTFVISGWRPRGRPVSFPHEYGSHTGPGVLETSAFSLLPSDAPLPARAARAYLRPWDLREAINRVLGRSVIEVSSEPRSPVVESRTLRLMTYNVHSCVGMDGKLSPDRVARIIARHAPDVVALQELDAHRPRTGGVNQPAVIAEKLGMGYLFQPALTFEQGEYGNAIMSHHAMSLVQAGWLPRLRERTHFQPRAALWALIELESLALQLINAHLSLWPKERLLQVEALLSERWLAHPRCRDPVVLCGDFNASPSSPVYRRIGGRLRDAQRALEDHHPRHTWFGRYPLSRIDHVFVSPGVEVVSIEVPSTELVKLASDHLPLIVEIRAQASANTVAEGSRLKAEGSDKA